MERYRILGMRGGFLIAKITQGTGIAILTVSVYLTFPKPFPELAGEWWKLVAPALFFTLGVLTIANLTRGTTLRSLVRKLEVRASRFIERTLLRIMDR